MDVSRETPDVTTKPECYDLADIRVRRFRTARGLPLQQHRFRYLKLSPGWAQAYTRKYTSDLTPVLITLKHKHVLSYFNVI